MSFMFLFLELCGVVMTLLTIVYIKTIDFYIIPILFVTFQRFAVVVTYFNKITLLTLNMAA